MTDLQPIGAGLTAAIDRLRAATPSANDQRYRCLKCRDSGIVIVMSPSMVKDAIAEEYHPASGKILERYSATMCTCQAGTAKVRLSDSVPSYGEPWHFRREDPDHMAKASAYKHKPEGYYEEFDAYA